MGKLKMSGNMITIDIKQEPRKRPDYIRQFNQLQREIDEHEKVRDGSKRWYAKHEKLLAQYEDAEANYMDAVEDWLLHPERWET